MINLTRAIPYTDYPKSDLVQYEVSNSKLMSLRELDFNRVIIRPAYTEYGAIDDCYVREEVVYRLQEALYLLPSKYTFCIYDCWRSYDVQHYLYKEFYNSYKSKFPNKSEDAILNEVKSFVSVPSKDLDKPTVHNTGGSIDLTILDKNFDPLHMGTDFDDFTKKSNTSYYEDVHEDIIARDNRRLLYNVMTQAGFTNLPSEWWHYDYGNHFWAYYTNNKALFKGVQDIY